MPPQAQNQPQRQGLGDLNAWYAREISSGEIWSAFLPPGVQLEQIVWDHIQAGLTYDKLQAYEAQLNHWGRQLMGAHRWEQVYAVANAVLGPGCYQMGAVMGIGLELHELEKQLVGAVGAIFQKKTLELGKLFVLAGMYEAAHPSQAGMMVMIVNPSTLAFWATGKVLDPFIGADMKAADIRVRKMLQEAYAIASDPKKLLGGAWGSMKKEYVDKWDRYVRLSKQTGLVNQFEAGKIAGGVLLEIALTVWAIVSGAELAVAGARAAAGVGRALFTVGAEEFAALTRGSAAVARAEAPEIVKFVEEGSPEVKGAGGGAEGSLGTSEKAGSGATSEKEPAPARNWSYQPKQTGRLEPGSTPDSAELKGQRATAKSRPGPATPDGWPAISNDAAQTFTTDPTPVTLPPGTKLYRVIGSDTSASGSFWSPDPPPVTEAAWRGGSAVKDEWNGDGGYVEYTVPDGGLKAWTGPTAPQPSALPGYALPGGEPQIWVPGGSIIPDGPPQPTPWNH